MNTINSHSDASGIINQAATNVKNVNHCYSFKSHMIQQSAHLSSPALKKQCEKNVVEKQQPEGSVAFKGRMQRSNNDFYLHTHTHANTLHTLSPSLSLGYA